MTLKLELAPSNTDDILYKLAGRPSLDLRFASLPRNTQRSSSRLLSAWANDLSSQSHPRVSSVPATKTAHFKPITPTHPR